MTDEPREEKQNQPEDEEVEGHLPPDPVPVNDKSRGEDEDVEGHSVPLLAPIEKPDTL